MAAPIDFYLDFSSPYAYLASTKIDELAAKHKREVNWRPFLLGAVFKITKSAPLVNFPLKNEYVRRDWERSARAFGIQYKLPTPFPFLSVAAARAFYWLNGRDPALARKFAKAVFSAAFVDAKDVTPAETVAEIAATLGVSKSDTLAALNDEQVKDKLRQEVDAAIERGVFGAPFIFVDGEPFWGSDRLEQVDRWLAKGGW
jgi:2-hydroxychromene-2-carboxylate isomerase